MVSNSRAIPLDALFAAGRIFFSGAWLSYVALMEWVGGSAYVASKVIAPFTYMLFFFYLGISATGRDTADFYLIGNAIETAMLAGIFGVTMAIGNERNIGTLAYLIGSPANRLVMFLGRAFFNIFDGFGTVLISFGWALVLGLDLSHANLPGLALTIVVVTLSTSGLGLLLGSISLMTVNVMFVNNFFFLLIWLVSGANVPLERFPGWLQTLSYAFPLTRAIQAARLAAGGSSIMEIGALLVGELAIGAVYALAGFVVFQWFESLARRRGSFEAF